MEEKLFNECETNGQARGVNKVKNPFSLFSDEELKAVEGWLEQHEVHKSTHKVECPTWETCLVLDEKLRDEKVDRNMEQEVISKENSRIHAIRQFRQATQLPLLQSKSMLEEVDFDVEKAIRRHNSASESCIEDDIEDDICEKNIMFYSKVETDDYPVDITCPHCNKGFYCRGFGAEALENLR